MKTITLHLPNVTKHLLARPDLLGDEMYRKQVSEAIAHDEAYAIECAHLADENGAPLRVYSSPEQAWQAHEHLKHDGWCICNYGGFENALVKLS